MSNKNKFYLTTPIYYVNARPHIGHAYTTIAADVIARRHRLLGDDTFFLTGTDEHGQKIQRSAEAAGIPPQQFADQVSAQFESLWRRMGITNDAYIRTTDPHHKKGVQKLFTQLQQNGFIELRSYTGQYCISDETFVNVPVGAPCPECGRITETVTEENYFFKLSQFQRQLIDLIESDTLAIQPDSRKNEVLSFLRGNVAAAIATNATEDSAVILSEAKNPNPSSDVILSEARSAESKDPESANPANASQTLSTPNLHYSAKGTPYVPGALKDLSISRTSVKWGIPVPGDEKHVIYVWLDALSNYMTAIGYGSEDPAEQAKFKNYWPADLHLVGKEIIRFHCVYWPAFLLALNPAIANKEPNDLPYEEHIQWAKDWLPKAITAHGWLLFEESKMSKSRGNIVRTETILDAFGTLCPPSPNAASTPSPEAVILSEARSAKEPALSEVEGKDPDASNPTDTAQTISATEPALSTPTKAEQDLFAADVLRYFLLREIPFGRDGSFSFDALIQRYNSDLANGYGNLVSRTLKMVSNYFQSVIPVPPEEDQVQQRLISKSSSFGDITTISTADLRSYVTDNASVVSEHFTSNNLSMCTAIFQSTLSFPDTYLTEQAPWKMAADEATKLRLAEVLYAVAESIRIITALLYPILPYATSKVWTQLGLGDIEEAARKGELKDLKWGGLKPGTKLGPLGPIFPRAPKELIQIMTDMEQNNTPQKPAQSIGLPQVNADLDASTHKQTEFLETPISSVSATPSLNKVAETVHSFAAPQTPEPVTPETPQIAIDDFIKIDLRVAQILVAERIPKADKLLRLEVDLGYERRQILSGIAEWYTPEELIGRKIVVITNLAPRKMRGLESHGMLLAASHGEDGKPVLATFGEEIALGSRLK